MRPSPAVGAALLQKDFRRACEVMVCQMHEVRCRVPGGSWWFLVEGWWDVRCEIHRGMFGIILDDAWWKEMRELGGPSRIFGTFIVFIG